jgi:endonuclease/exonuclease/phosphatase (EEP) superfamily protein YafD
LSAAGTRPPAPGRGRAVPFLAALLALAFAGSHVPGPFALLDNLSNFPAHFGAAFVACAALLARRGRLLAAIACGTLAAFALARVVPWYFAPEAAPAEPGRHWARIVVSNVYAGNPHYRRLLALVRDENPDVVGLVEVDSRWLRKLKPLRRAYPHHYELPDEQYAGLALYSRFPIEGARTLRLPGEHAAHAITATLKLAGVDVEIVLAHPTAPIGAEYIAKRNAQVAAIVRHASATRAPLVLAGDLNLTMWNDAYRPLEEVAQLHNARTGHGIGPTWPALGPIGVPIDHILGSPGVRLRKFRVLPAVGSDHFPVAAEFSVR